MAPGNPNLSPSLEHYYSYDPSASYKPYTAPAGWDAWNAKYQALPETDDYNLWMRESKKTQTGASDWTKVPLPTVRPSKALEKRLSNHWFSGANFFKSLPVVGDVVRGAEQVIRRPGDIINKPGQFFGKVAAGAAPFLAGPLGKPIASAIGAGGHALQRPDFLSDPLNVLMTGASIAAPLVGGETGRNLKYGVDAARIARDPSVQNVVAAGSKFLPSGVANAAKIAGTVANVASKGRRAMPTSNTIPDFVNSPIGQPLAYGAPLPGSTPFGANNAFRSGDYDPNPDTFLVGGGPRGAAAGFNIPQLATLGIGAAGGLFNAPNDKGNFAGAGKTVGEDLPGYMQGYAKTGGVDPKGSTDPYALLPHETEQLNQGIMQINAQRQAATGQKLQEMVSRGLDPTVARLVAQNLNKHFDSEIAKHRSGFMEQVRQNRQNTYGGLAQMEGQQFGQQMDLGRVFAGLDATQQSNLRTLLGQIMAGLGNRPGAPQIPNMGGGQNIPFNDIFGGAAGVGVQNPFLDASGNQVLPGFASFDPIQDAWDATLDPGYVDSGYGNYTGVEELGASVPSDWLDWSGASQWLE